ncbi:triose-phosphate isomerase [Malassezia psittaci]|uniref:Triosephosphate isomerase n=1 Tax=Malassezia psittaci TaxID=1821823 RepID=A0AAF0JEF3_9BASI|nr:triose-phosphate isomerase [Malassezia psittaci]
MTSNTGDAAARRRLVGTSLKMYFDLHRTQEYVREVVACMNQVRDFPPQDSSGRQALDLFLIPDFVSLLKAAELISDCRAEFWIGAQDTFDQDSGAFTGEVSPKTLSQAGCRLVEIGHAERRRLFGETDSGVAKKAAAVVRNNMIPLVCVGEVTYPGQNTELAVNECWQQIQAVFEMVPADKEVVLAYEPVWAIGKEKPASSDHIVAVTQALRSRVLVECPNRKDAKLRIIYGGSAQPGMFNDIQEGVDGLFLGRFAHDAKQFVQTLQEVYQAGRS